MSTMIKRRTACVTCPECAAERQARIALNGEVARVCWALKKARNRLKEIAQQTAALVGTLEVELRKAEAAEHLLS